MPYHIRTGRYRKGLLSGRLAVFLAAVVSVLFTSSFLFQHRKWIVYLPPHLAGWIAAVALVLSASAVLWALRFSWRREAHEALRENEERLRISQRIAQIGSWDWDLATGRVECTDEIYRIFGIGGGSFPHTYAGFLQVLPSEERHLLSDAIKSALYGSDGYRVEHRVLRPGGEKRIVLETGEVFRNEAGEPLRVVSVVRDITERKQAERALKESEEWFRSTFEEAAVGICHLDPQRKVVRVNRRFCDITGYRPEELVGRPLDDLTQGEDLSRDRELERKLVEGEIEEYAVERRYLRPDGAQVWVSVSESVARSSSGERRYFIAVVEDITGKRETEALRREHDLVKAASLAKSRFLANMSHEIRTPMNAVIGLSLLALKTNLNQKQRGYLEKIHASSRVLLNIINDVLEFSRFEAGSPDLEHLDFNPLQLLKSVHDLFSAKAAEKGISLRFLVDPELPEQLLGDALRLTQVLTNLVGNAIKFTDRGGVLVGVEQCGTARGEVSVRFFVKDTGLGIATEQLESVFTPFTQADTSTTRRFGGTGLGLSIGRQLVEAMEGVLEVESALGVGSTFSFTVPLGISPQDESLPPLEVSRLLPAAFCADKTLPQPFLTRLRALGVEVKKGGTLSEELSCATAPGARYDLALLHYRDGDAEIVERVRRLRRNRALAGLSLAVVAAPEEVEKAMRDLPDLDEAAFVPLSLEGRPLFHGMIGALIPRRPWPPGDAASDTLPDREGAAALPDAPLPSVENLEMDLETRERVAQELVKLERLLSKNSLDAKKQYLRLLREIPAGSFQNELKAMALCLDRLDFRKAREILGRVGHWLQVKDQP